MYALGKQPVDKYKKMFSPGKDPSDDSWRAIDWTPPAFICKYREIALSKLLQKQYDLQAYAIDPLAKSEEDAFFDQMKVKILMREAAQQAGSELANSPMLEPQPGEPQDLEQLAIYKDYGYKHVMATEAENAFNLVFQQNDIEEKRKEYLQHLYDWGIGGLTQDIDEKGNVVLRVLNPEYLGLSYCEKADFSDLVHWWELVPTYVADLAPYYTKDQLDDICKKAMNKNGNPSTYLPVSGLFNQSWNRFKVFVMKIRFLSWNDTVYKEETDGRSNLRFGKSSYKNKQFLSVGQEGKLEEKGETENDDYYEPLEESGTQGAATPKYINCSRKVVYKASWVVETDYMHDYGIKENQNRKLSSWWNTDLDVQLYAWNFYKMQFTGITERLIPLEDKACMTWFNLQNLSNKLIPYLINIDFNAVEAVNFGKNGQKQKPSQIIDFIFSNYIVPFRSLDLVSRNPNYKPVSIEATGQLAAFSQLYEELGHTLEMMRQISGLNELTDGSTPNAKTLVPVANAAMESTNNAIYLISDADKKILQRTADAIIQKVQIAVKLGKVAGYAKALGTNTVSFFNINPDLSLHELGIFIQDAPSEAERQALWQDLQVDTQQGLITIGDKAFIMTVRNIKEAYKLLDYKIQKRKEEQQQFALQQQQAQAQGVMQQQAQLEQMKQQTAQMLHQMDMEKINAQGQWTYQTEAMKKQSDLNEAHIQAEAKVISNQIMGQSKVDASHVAANSNVTTKHVQGQYDMAMTDMDNEAAIEAAKHKAKTKTTA